MHRITEAALFLLCAAIGTAAIGTAAGVTALTHPHALGIRATGTPLAVAACLLTVLVYCAAASAVDLLAYRADVDAPDPDEDQR